MTPEPPMIADPFVAGSVTALESFLAEMVADRGRIENEDEPVFEVIADLLQRTITVLRGFQA
jgi:hypothetical protein